MKEEKPPELMKKLKKASHIINKIMSRVNKKTKSQKQKYDDEPTFSFNTKNMKFEEKAPTLNLDPEVTTSSIIKTIE